MAQAPTSEARVSAPRWLARWPILLGFALLAVPTVSALSEQSWSRESGAHGPIILATGGWLIWRELTASRAVATPGSGWATALVVVVALFAYIFGRAFDFITFEAAGLYLMGLAILYSEVGSRLMLKSWFPLFYLAFAIPPPNTFMDQVTAPLKQFVSFVATTLLRSAGLPIERQGVTINIADYQLLVQDACSGMNSLVGLIAISLFYIFLLRGSSVRYSLLLTAFVIPIAIAGNIVRIITLILLTYFFGDEVAQGFAHFAAGIFLFAVDLLLVFLVDNLLSRITPLSWRPK